MAWNAGPWSLRGVVMKVNENDDGNDFTFYGTQLGYTLQTELGEGNYRVLVDRTSASKLATTGINPVLRGALRDPGIGMPRTACGLHRGGNYVMRTGMDKYKCLSLAPVVSAPCHVCPGVHPAVR